MPGASVIAESQGPGARCIRGSSFEPAFWIGRPDLRAVLGWSSRDLAEMLYESLHDGLMSLPGDTRV